MGCKFCIPQVNSRTGKPELDENGQQYMYCPIDCLPLRGRLQRLIYENIYGENEYPRILKQVQSIDPDIAQGNISRAISSLKKKGYIFEGEDCGKRLICTASAYKSGDVDVGFYDGYGPVVPSAHLRHLLYWFLSKQNPNKYGCFNLSDRHLIEVAGLIIDSVGTEGVNAAGIYEWMEVLVKRMRYIIHELQDKKTPIPEWLAKKESIENWENRTMTPLRKKKKRGSGWDAYVPYYLKKWNVLCEDGKVAGRILQVAKESDESDEFEEKRAKLMFQRMSSID